MDDPVLLSRLQFAITIMFHYIFPPMTIGLGVVLVALEGLWLKTKNELYHKQAKFWTRIFGIIFALGVASGIVMEFQFGMNWSDYSRFVGDIFGAPLAVEGLLAFFLESTFLGLWIFGWDRLPKKLHLATIWLAATGTLLSAYFILAANSFMQNPVGYVFNPQTQRAEMTDFGEVLLQPLAMITFTHVISTAFLVSGLFVAGISGWLLYKKRSLDVVRSTLKLGSITAIVAFFAVGITGDAQATKIITVEDPVEYRLPRVNQVQVNARAGVTFASALRSILRQME